MSAPHETRRTFAIISHPDAGKTTLTEHLLKASGAIQLAGQVRARGERRRTQSDWMEIEQKRGISVTSSVMTFERDGLTFNLLDTPGHSDFSEDTYRTLTAVDSAVMVIDAARGIEAQTLKLFEICRLRNIPIITFVNKIDREGRDPLEILDEIAETLALDVTPANWPVGMGVGLQCVLDLMSGKVIGPHGEAQAGNRRRTRGQGQGRVRGSRLGPRLRRAGTGAGTLAAIRSRALPRRAPDAGVLRLGHPQPRRAGPARRRGALGAAAAAAAGRPGTDPAGQ